MSPRKPWPQQRLAILGGILFLLFLTPACHSREASRLSWVLQASWASYRQQFIAPEGRVVLKDQGHITISEAQGYALLRSLWAGDEETFRRVYQWTWNHLSRRATHGDHLLAWKWGPKPDGSWGVLDENTASDGDLDYALALWLAHRRGWQAPPGLPDYLEEARRVAGDLLAKAVVELPDGTLLLSPGNWHPLEPPYLLNPSYFFPAAYRCFLQAGFDSRFGRLHADAYPFLQRLSFRMGGSRGVGLIPDWVQVEADGSLGPAPERSSDFGWEAVRLPWRLAVDRLWFGDLAAARLCRERFLPFFHREWRTSGKLAAVYSYEGQPRAAFESPVMYAGALAAALAGGDREFAWQMAQKILSFYQEKAGQAYFVAPDNYYANNWAWLGLALYAEWVKLY